MRQGLILLDQVQTAQLSGKEGSKKWRAWDYELLLIVQWLPIMPSKLIEHVQF